MLRIDGFRAFKHFEILKPFFERLVLLAFFRNYLIETYPGLPPRTSRVSRNMRKSGENCLLPGNAFADAQKMMKIADFYAHIPVGVLQENQVQRVLPCFQDF